MDIEKLIDPEIKQILEFGNKEANQDLIGWLNHEDRYFLRSKILRTRAECGTDKPVQTPSDNVIIENRIISGPPDYPELLVRIYRPKVDSPESLRPTLFYIHGGGFFSGVPEDADPVCCRIVDEVQCLIVSVDYRLAPEHPFPAALDDCYAALSWLSENSDSLGVDKSKIAVAGHSAGGCLAAGVTLMARDRNGPAIIYQMLIYPVLDDRHITHSSRSVTHPAIWNREVSLAAWKAYLGPSPTADMLPYAAPARAEDLTGLPPAYILAADLDLLRDEAVEYSIRLTRSGVTSELHVFPGTIHGFDFIPLTSSSGVAQRAIGEYIKSLKGVLS